VAVAEPVAPAATEEAAPADGRRRPTGDVRDAGRRPRLALPRLFGRLTSALRGGWDPEALLAGGPRHTPVYLAAGLLFALAALPFALARAEGFAPGLTGIPAPGVYDSLGRAISIVREGPLPDGFSRGPVSPLWTWLLAVGHLATGWGGLPVAALAKLLGFAAGLVGALVLYNLALRATASRWPGIVALGLIALDPALAYGRVAGAEAPLFFALGATAVLALALRRYRLLAWLMAALALTRPDGVLVVAALTALVAVAMLRRAGSGDGPRADVVLAALLGLVGPALAATLLWSLHGLIVGEPSASPLRALGAGPTVGGLAATWNSWLSGHPLVGSFFVVLTVVGAGWSTLHLGRLWGTAGLAPLLLALVPLYSLSTTAELPAAGWSYDVRRIGEPALPWLAFGVALALSAAGAVIWETMRGVPARLRGLPLGRVIGLLPLSLWALTALLLWTRLPSDFAFGARNVAEAPLALSAWIAQNTPANARIAYAPGAEPVRALANRVVRELPVPLQGGAHPGALREALRARGFAYLAAYRGSTYAAWPQAREIARAASNGNVALPSPEIALFRLQEDLPKVEATEPRSLELIGYTVVDRLDVGAGASETAHLYQSPGRGALVRAESPATGGWFEDDGRAQEAGRGSESFTLQARQGRDLLLAVRYDAASRGSLRVELGGQSHELSLKECPTPLCEDVLLLPAERIGGPFVRLTTSFVGTPGARIATYHYWSIVRS
jgi:hypothetical protein